MLGCGGGLQGGQGGPGPAGQARVPGTQTQGLQPVSSHHELVHQSYIIIITRINLNHDIALLRLWTPLDLSSHVSSVKLPVRDCQAGNAGIYRVQTIIFPVQGQDTSSWRVCPSQAMSSSLVSRTSLFTWYIRRRITSNRCGDSVETS